MGARAEGMGRKGDVRSARGRDGMVGFRAPRWVALSDPMLIPCYNPGIGGRNAEIMEDICVRGWPHVRWPHVRRRGPRRRR